ncbi:MAG: aquaporin [Ferruginibacter sp.]
MRAITLPKVPGKSGIVKFVATFNTNFKLYLMEALGLAIFMISACFFGAMLEGNDAIFHNAIPDAFERSILMGVLMGATALFIFYSPFTAPSGAHINPAVTITFFRLNKIGWEDSLFYCCFQLIGGTIAVYAMRLLMGDLLIATPVNSVVTVPGKAGVAYAALMEFCIAFIMITMLLFTSAHQKIKAYTRIFAACMVCIYVIIAGPVSGFGMNPARSFASAFPSGIYTSFWIYLFIPFAGMLTAAEFFVQVQSMINKTKSVIRSKNIHLKNSDDEAVCKDLSF